MIDVRTAWAAACGVGTGLLAALAISHFAHSFALAMGLAGGAASAAAAGLALVAGGRSPETAQPRSAVFTVFALCVAAGLMFGGGQGHG